MNYKKRVRWLQERMDKQDLDLVIYGSSSNFQYLTGLDIDWRLYIEPGYPWTNIFVPREGDPILTADSKITDIAEKCWIDDVRIVKRVAQRDSNYTEVIKQVASDMDGNEGNIAVGDHVWGSSWIEVAQYFKGAKFYNGKSLMEDLIMIKETEEVEKLRKVAKLTDDVMEEIINGITDGVTQSELQFEIEMLGRKKGATHISFPPTAGFVKSGSEATDDPFLYPMDEGLKKGTSIAFDIGFVYDGYCSDWGRSMYWGPAENHVKKGYEALMQAVISTVDNMGAGNMKVNDIFPSIESYLDGKGYGNYIRARLKNGLVGHQIGIECHENPWLTPSSNMDLKEGMVMCLEPKIWHAGEYYLRVEDMVLIKKDKGEFLTKYDRKQFQL